MLKAETVELSCLFKTAVQERPWDWEPSVIWPVAKRVHVVELQTECPVGPGRHSAYAVTGADANTD